MNDRGAGQATTSVGHEAASVGGAAGINGASTGAGAMLRDARLAQGLHIAALAASIKVPQAKLEALEAERYADLPDATFTRALAQAVCRALKVDSAPVLAHLPSAGPMALDKVERGLNTPFRDRPGRIDPLDRLWLRHPVTWVVLALLLGAAAVAFVPTEWLRGVTGSKPANLRASSEDAKEPVPALPPSKVGLDQKSSSDAKFPTSEPGATAGFAAATSTGAMPGLPAVPLSEAASATATPSVLSARASDAEAASLLNAPVQVRATDATWVQISDPNGKILFSRVVAAGETTGVDAQPPMRVRIGNAKGTELRLRGQLVDIAPATRGNTATVDLR